MTNSWNHNLFMTRAQIREYDRAAIEDLRIPSVVLMENAGRGAAEFIANKLSGKGSVSIVAGPGNNGGDGFVVARHLANFGTEAKVYLTSPKEDISGDSKTNLEIWEAMDGEIIDVTSGRHLPVLQQALRNSEITVDAVLGTGVSRNVEGHLSAIIELINTAATHVISLDIPSGLDADSGMAWGKAARARATVTFGHIKRGLLLYPGAGLAGEIHVVSIGVPAKVSEKAGIDGRIISEDLVRPLIPSRAANAHKGTFGHLLVIAGSLGKSGAAALAGMAAMRVGTGLVTVGTSGVAQPIIESKSLEVMVESIIDKTDSPLTDKVIGRLEQLLEGKKALALGPGISTAPGISALTMKLLQRSEIPAVIDADGINIIAKDPTSAGKISAPMVFTPHPGEMARLTNKTVASIQADRVGAARDAARWHQAVIVLKGAHTVVASPEGDTFICPTGNPGMASGGTGDVLTGIIGGLLAQGLSPIEAAITGVYLHGHAGDLAAERVGMPGLLASNLLEELPAILKAWDRLNCQLVQGRPHKH